MSASHSTPLHRKLHDQGRTTNRDSRGASPPRNTLGLISFLHLSLFSAVVAQQQQVAHLSWFRLNRWSRTHSIPPVWPRICLWQYKTWVGVFVPAVYRRVGWEWVFFGGRHFIFTWGRYRASVLWKMWGEFLFFRLAWVFVYVISFYQDYPVVSVFK